MNLLLIPSLRKIYEKITAKKGEVSTKITLAATVVNLREVIHRAKWIARIRPFRIIIRKLLKSILKKDFILFKPKKLIMIVANKSL